MQAINQRRDRYRQQIRKVERQAFFLQERMKMMEHYEHTVSIGNIMSGIRQKQQLQFNLDEVIRIINGANYKSNIFSLIQAGLVQQLMVCLKDRVCIRLALETISYLLQRSNEIKHGIDLHERFHNLNIFEYLLHFVKDNEFSNICTYIIFDYSETKEDYCEVLTELNGYKTLMDIFIVRIKYGCDQSDHEASRYFKYILNTLENILMMKESALDYQAQKFQIFDFVIYLIKNHLFLRTSFGILYECIKCLGSRIVDKHMKLLNEVIVQLKIHSLYFQNLMASVYLLTPSKYINYSALFDTAIKHPKSYKILSMIFQKLVKDTEDNQSIHKIPTAEQYWERLMLQQDDEQTFKRFLMVIELIKIQEDFVFRMISGSLDTLSVSIQKDLLHLLHIKIIDNKKTSLVQMLVEKHFIAKRLEPLTNSKNSYIRLRANNLMDYILGPLADMGSRIQ